MTPGLPRRQEFFLAQAEPRHGDAVRFALLIVFGAVGTLARYGLQGMVQERASLTFPYGTLVVNLVGCFFLGAVAQYGLTHLTIAAEWRVGITVGFFGASPHSQHSVGRLSGC